MARSAKAAILREPRTQFVIEEIEIDEVRPNEVLVRVEACGVCHTDAFAMQALPVPSVLGHEGAGQVEAVGKNVTSVRPGDTVIISYPSCGGCANCLAKRPFICEQIIDLKFAGHRADGSSTIRAGGQPVTSSFFQQSSFATHAVTLETNLISVPRKWKAEILAALPCGVLTGAGSILNIFKHQKRDSLAVIGVGAVGMSAIMVAKLLGVSPLIAIDVNPERLEMARQLGATHILNARDPDLLKLARTVTPSGIDYILDTSGHESAIANAIGMIAMGGELALVTIPEPYPSSESHLNQFFMKAGTIRCVIVGASDPRVLLPQLLEWYDEGRFPIDRLVATYPFASINAAFAEAKAGKVIKPVLLMS